MEIPGIHPSLQSALVLVNLTWPVELQKEPRSSLLFHQSITSLPWGDLTYSFGHQISWGRSGELEMKQKYGRLKRGGTAVELDIGKLVQDKGKP